MPHRPHPPPRIFLSYARSDRDFAIALRDELMAGGLAVWHDLKDLAAGQWWSQIADALEGKSIEHIVLIASADALASKVVAQECWLAQREGKTASLVVPPAHKGRINFKLLPRFMQSAHHYDLTEPDQKTKFVQQLREPGHGPRRPRPENRRMPAEYVARNKEYDEMRAALLEDQAEATTATVVLTGPGGFGKTTLATAFVNDEAVQQAYFNGILLVELGEGLAKLPKTYDGRKTLEGLIKAKIETLIKTLAGRDERLDELEAAKARLKELLDKHHGAVLLWIDDAWDAGHAQHFIDGAPNAAKLVTTRIRDMFPNATARVDVDELTREEAAALMEWCLNPTKDTERAGLGELATITAGRWPILIRQINAQLRYQTAAQTGRKAQALGDAITSLRARLKREGIDDLDKSTDTNRATAVRLSIGVSFGMLVHEDRHRDYPDGFHAARYLDLAGFREPEVPIATIARLWGHLGVLRRAEPPTLDARDETVRREKEARWRAELREESIAILERLYALALLQKLDAEDADGMVRLHDVMRQYLTDKEKDTIAEFHQQFVHAYHAESRGSVSNMTERERRYFYTWFPTHLYEATKEDVSTFNKELRAKSAFDQLLLDPEWMHRKIMALRSVHSLLSDYHLNTYASQSPQGLVARALRLSAHVLSQDPDALAEQLWARLYPASTKLLVRDLPRSTSSKKLTAPRPNLELASGAFLEQLHGHNRTVTAIAVDPAKRICFSSDGHGIINKWNLDTGHLVATLGPCKDAILSLAVDRVGKVIYAGCGSGLNSSRWSGIAAFDSETGVIKWEQPIHEEPVAAICLNTSKGIGVSAGWDRQLRLWHMLDGCLQQSIEAHQQGLNALATDREWKYAATGASDGRLRLWDLPQLAQICDIVVSPVRYPQLDPYLLESESVRNLMADWDYVLCTSFDPVATRIATGDAGGNVRIFNLDGTLSVACEQRFRAEIQGLAFSPDGKHTVVGDEDGTLIVHDAKSGAIVGLHYCGASIRPVCFVDSDIIVCGAGRKVMLISLQKLLESHLAVAEALKDQAGISKVRWIDADRFIALSRTGLLYEVAADSLVVTRRIIDHVWNFSVVGNKVFVLLIDSIKVLDVENWTIVNEFDITEWALRGRGQIAIEMFCVVQSKWAICVVHSGEWVLLYSLDLESGQTICDHRFGWSDHGHEVFQIMGGIRQKYMSSTTTHGRSHVICSNDDSGGIVVYFSHTGSVKYIDATMRQKIATNFAELFGYIGHPKPTPSLDKKGALTGEFGLQRRVSDIQIVAGIIVVVSRDNQIEFFDSPHGGGRTVGLSEEIVSHIMANSSRPNRLFVVSNKAVIEFDVSEMRVRHRIEAEVRIARVWGASIDGKQLVCSTHRESIAVVNMEMDGLEAEYYFDASVTDVDIRSEDRRLLVGTGDGRVHILHWY